MEPHKKRAIIIISLIVGITIVLPLALYFNSSRNKKSPIPTTSLPDAHPPQEVVSVVTKYVQARENAVGADRATSTSWLEDVRSITTPEWFTRLQPLPNSSAGSASAEYNTARKNGYVIRASLSKCIWNFKLALPTANEGAIYCDLVDTVTNKDTDSEILSSSLPFGWSRSGQQNPVSLKVVKQNGSWLVNEDTGAEAD